MSAGSPAPSPPRRIAAGGAKIAVRQRRAATRRGGEYAESPGAGLPDDVRQRVFRRDWQAKRAPHPAAKRLPPEGVCRPLAAHESGCTTRFRGTNDRAHVAGVLNIVEQDDELRSAGEDRVERAVGPPGNRHDARWRPHGAHRREYLVGDANDAPTGALHVLDQLAIGTDDPATAVTSN